MKALTMLAYHNPEMEKCLGLGPRHQDLSTRYASIESY